MKADVRGEGSNREKDRTETTDRCIDSMIAEE